jgi:predicted flap endonuclease-1-like 5' DNA nuclease
MEDQMTKLVDIEGIGKVQAKKLTDAGVRSVEDFLKQGGSPAGRAALAEKTGISSSLLLEWINHCDLFRIKGVAEEYSDLLEEAGVDTVPELAQRNAANLYAKLVEVQAQKKLVRKMPVESQVADWIAQAKQLPRIITY